VENMHVGGFSEEQMVVRRGPEPESRQQDSPVAAGH
jgi:hypothetical protein